MFSFRNILICLLHISEKKCVSKGKNLVHYIILWKKKIFLSAFSRLEILTVILHFQTHFKISVYSSVSKKNIYSRESFSGNLFEKSANAFVTLFYKRKICSTDLHHLFYEENAPFNVLYEQNLVLGVIFKDDAYKMILSYFSRF